MSKQQFKVGDRVRVVKSKPSIINGKVGTLTAVKPLWQKWIYCVELDEKIPGIVKNVGVYEVEHIHKHPVIVITTDGKTTTATMREGKKIIKTATAKCSDKDTFDFAEGARIAFERLRGREPFSVKAAKSPFPKKVVCVSCDSKSRMFTPGKIYTTSHDHFWCTDTLYAVSTNYTNLTCGIVESKIVDHYEINNFPWFAEFIPLVED